jgi:acetyl-CoA carboxylase biotin carboxyl carrier protein
VPWQPRSPGCAPGADGEAPPVVRADAFRIGAAPTRRADAGAMREPACRSARARILAGIFSSTHTSRAGSGMASIEIKSEITGTVWQLKVQVGDKVEEGDTLIVIESMKMEIPVITEDAGTVKELRVQEKDPVAEGQVVAIIED